MDNKFRARDIIIYSMFPILYLTAVLFWTMAAFIYSIGALIYYAIMPFVLAGGLVISLFKRGKRDFEPEKSGTANRSLRGRRR